MHNSVEQPGRVRLAALPPLALYVHIPWCVRKCPYCDFNSHERAGALPEAENLLRKAVFAAPAAVGAKRLLAATPQM